MADPATLTPIVIGCIKGLQQIHRYCGEFQGAKRKLNELVSECKAFNRIIDRIKGSTDYTNDAEIRETLDDFRELFHIFHEQFRPLIDLAESENPNKISIIRLRISATWKADDIDSFRGTISKQATLLNLLLITHTARKRGTIQIDQSTEIHRLKRGIASDTDSLRTSIYTRETRNYQQELLDSRPYKTANVKLPLRTKLFQRLAVGSSSKDEQSASQDQLAPTENLVPKGSAAKSNKDSENVATKKIVNPEEVRRVQGKLRSWAKLSLEVWAVRDAVNRGLPNRGEDLADRMKKQDAVLRNIIDEIADWPDAVVGDEERGLVMDLVREVDQLKMRMNFPEQESEILEPEVTD
ncbi:hypothetical protein QBC38DRAFT_493555 [Podospora fimiseda]|uniref:Fungal N-terminal domain-containing protein n=1 Tax=Podospora fimiseda TaxID=252190 RepID=A0AAN6YK45_9PEZI|nr:hypothetical protein QBC38DRAFT_493555 [Podospora fimiseda]